ncbi:chromosome segregation ATPase-like protein [Gloeothece citriformis PCC 7424]|uniref:Chromosome segregation ATPase-like protein n=1 Tax=Gloeothece citriformis (strain PCC 7424) TaxID=65393 RepID=B7K7C8_GLOC7|nr:sulfotransferase [Gloeothece citriformis]ACK69696.1 chromosome segregation ATPase-like protein [Gloeothece citriformis PCC 7424]
MSNLQQPILIITGMHRSGTSLTASLLQSAGLDIGNILPEAALGNIKGHFESQAFLNFHQSVLGSVGISPDGWTIQKTIYPPEYYVEKAKQLIETQASPTNPWGWKDPRTTLFINFWSELLPSAKFLFLYRSPWEVVDSLYRRGSDNDKIFHHNPELALKVWMNYNEEILDFYQKNSQKSLLIHINKVTENPEKFIAHLVSQLEIPLNNPDSSIYESSLLKRQTAISQRPILIKHFFPEAFDLYCKLNFVSEFQDDIIDELESTNLSTAWILQDWLDSKLLTRNLKSAKTELETYQNELQHVHNELYLAHKELQQAHEELEKTHKELYHTHKELDNAHKELENTQNQWRQTQSQLEISQNHLRQTQGELETSQGQLRQTQEELEISQGQLRQTQGELETSQGQLRQTQGQLRQTQGQLESSQIQLKEAYEQWEQTQNQLEQALEKWEKAQMIIQAMESSKFWKMRRLWFKIKPFSPTKA